MTKKKVPCEVYSRVVGYLTSTSQWNVGKKQEFKDRKEYLNSSDVQTDQEKDVQTDT